MKRKRPKLVLVDSLIIFLFIAVMLLSYYQGGSLITGLATLGSFSVGMCANTPPKINHTTCPISIIENETLICQIVMNNTEFETYAYLTAFINETNLFDVNSSGGIYSTFNTSDIGNHSYNVTIQDNSGCANSLASFNFSLEVLSEGNHPPYLVQNIPDQKWLQDTVLAAFDLNNYFADPDSDPLNFTSDIISNIAIQIDMFGIVTLIPIAGFYGVEYVYFYATDPFNASASSNRVKLEVEQIPEPDPPLPQGSSGGGSLKSGAISIDCFPEWECSPWSACFPQGVMYRDCVDLNNCSSQLQKPDVTQACNYTISCDDGVQNGDEQGVDCGGSCPDVCPLPEQCFDGTKNNGELQIDCGGPCPVCPQKEESCFDSIKNQDEQGIDCGGVCEEKCEYEEQPIILSWLDWRRLFLIILILIIIYEGSYYTYKHRYEIKRACKKVRKGFRALIAKKQKLQFRLIEKIEKLEEKLYKKTADRAIGELSSIMNDYLAIILQKPGAMTTDEAINEIKKSELDPSLKKVLESFYKDIGEIVFSTKHIAKPFVFSIIYEAKNIIITTLDSGVQGVYEMKSKLEIEEKDEVYNLMAKINNSFSNNNHEEMRNYYKKLHSLVSSKKLKDRYVINSLKRLKNIFDYKNAKNK